MADDNGRNIKVNIGMITIVTLLILQLVGFAFGYGMLTQQVSFNQDLIKNYQITQVSLSTKMDDLSSRLTKIETLLHNQ